MDTLRMIRVYRDGRMDEVHPSPPSLHDPATGVASKDVVIDPGTGVSARLYLPDLGGDKEKKKLPVVVYYHGGGFLHESAFSPTYHPYLNSLANKAGVLVVSVEYRLAPEHPIPAAYDDAWLALQWVTASGGGEEEWLKEHADLSRVFLAGDSAGGNIVHNVAMRAGGREEELNLKLKLKGGVLVHPFFWGPKRIGAEAEERDSILNAPMMDGLWSVVCPAAAVGEEDPRLNPLAEGAPSLAALGCGRVLVCVAEKDLMADRGRAYYEGLKGSGWGGEAEVYVSEEEDHVFHLFKPECNKGMVLMERLVAFINH